MRVDLTVVAIPAYVGAMVAGYRWQRRHPVAVGAGAVATGVDGDRQYRRGELAEPDATDVASADTWRDRWSFLLRGPGWAYEHRQPALG